MAGDENPSDPAQVITIALSQGIAIDQLTHQVYVANGIGLGTVTVLSDHTAICASAVPASATEDFDQIKVDLYSAADQTSRDLIAMAC